jgi:alkanesulfonate monooxygenase SsuD/methylene tetrahydromethanopterin reductase-like flavin-dependent oxidoreductase (luciferase family)
VSTKLFDSFPAFGITVSSRPGADPVAEAVHAEKLGFDVVTVHRDVLNGPPPSLESWTLLTWLAARTTAVRLAPNVLVLPNRHPAVLAKMAETLDQLSGGRLILALGSGAGMNDPAFSSFGLPHWLAAEKVVAMGEALDVMRGLWEVAGFSYPGRHFRIEDATLEPKPARRIPVWLGAFRPRMLDLVGRKADGWLPSMFMLEPEAAYLGMGRIRQAARSAGRDPDQLTFGYNVAVTVRDGATSSRGEVSGSAEEVAEQLAALVRGGFSFLNLSTTGEGAEQRERLAADVLPAVRSLSASRARAGTRP